MLQDQILLPGGRSVVWASWWLCYCCCWWAAPGVPPPCPVFVAFAVPWGPKGWWGDGIFELIYSYLSPR